MEGDCERFCITTHYCRHKAEKPETHHHRHEAEKPESHYHRHKVEKRNGLRPVLMRTNLLPEMQAVLICSEGQNAVSFTIVNVFQSDPIPGPLPLGVAVIDSSVKLYGVIFPRVAHKHRYQMLQHFIECIRQAKSSRQQAVQMNIFTAVLCALKVKTYCCLS